MATKTNGMAVEAVSPQWEVNHASYLSGRAVLDGVDALAMAMEAKWGADRLRLLVSAATREKFDRQRFKTNAAIMHGTLQEVIEQGNRMMAAWRVANSEASAIGAQPLAREVWEVTLENGSVAAIVPTTAHAKLVQAENRKVAVFTLEEIGHMLSVWEGVTRAKLQWPGAEVTKTRRHVPDPLDGIPKGARTLNDTLDDI